MARSIGKQEGGGTRFEKKGGRSASPEPKNRTRDCTKTTHDPSGKKGRKGKRGKKHKG